MCFFGMLAYFLLFVNPFSGKVTSDTLRLNLSVLFWVINLNVYLHTIEAVSKWIACDLYSIFIQFKIASAKIVIILLQSMPILSGREFLNILKHVFSRILLIDNPKLVKLLFRSYMLWHEFGKVHLVIARIMLTKSFLMPIQAILCLQFSSALIAFEFIIIKVAYVSQLMKFEMYLLFEAFVTNL